MTDPFATKMRHIVETDGGQLAQNAMHNYFATTVADCTSTGGFTEFQFEI